MTDKVLGAMLLIGIGVLIGYVKSPAIDAWVLEKVVTFK
jgi:hypothetical protein